MNSEILNISNDMQTLAPLLLEGELERDGKKWVALPREKISYSQKNYSVLFELIEATHFKKPRFLRIILSAIRQDSLTQTLTPGVCVLLYGIFMSWPLSLGLSICALMGALFFQIAGNLFNDVEDHCRLLDFDLKATGSAGVIQKGWLSAKEMKKWAYRALILGILLGLPAVLRSPQLMIFVGGAGFLGVLGYSNRPFGMKYRSLGDLLIFLLAGPFFTIGFSQATFGKIDFSVFSLGLTFGFLAWEIAYVKSLRNLSQNTLKSTVARSLLKSKIPYLLKSSSEFYFSRHLCTVLLVLCFTSFISAFIFGNLPAPVGAMSLVILPEVFYFIRKIYRASGPASPLLSHIRRDVAKLHFRLGIFIIIGFVIAIKLR